jgi:DNA repair protein RadC
MKVKELPFDDRPREKLILRGSKSLSDAELLAILLRTGTKGKSVLYMARDMLIKYKNLSSMASVSVAALTKNNGIGNDKAATLAAAFELSRRISSQDKLYSNSRITSPKDIADIFIPVLRDEIKENFIVICLNSANKIIKHETISIGNLNSSIVHPREVYKVAIDNSSANIILLHNHPSGNPEPSNEDILVTRKLIDAGILMDIKVFDHIIIAGDSYISFVEKKLM